MKKESDIRVEMFRVEDDLAPFVMVDYVDKYAQEHSGLMLLDSGSSANVLSSEMGDGIGELCRIDDDGTTILSISEETMNVENVKFSFAFGGKQFSEIFCLSRQQLPVSIKGMKVLGILGNKFLQTHRLVIDYSDYTLHTSNVSPENLSISDCGFFFPMNIGLEFYGLPVVSVKQNGKELVTLVDTGATDNMIAKQALVDNEFKYKHLNKKDVMIGVAGKVEVDEARVWFNMMSLDSDDVCEISRRARFKILPYNIYTLPEGTCDTNGDPLPPIEVLLGSPFMANEGWALDFGANIIYKRKSEGCLKEAV